MDRKILEEHIVKINPEALFADGYDRAIKGIGFRDNIPVVLYSSERCIQQLMEDNNWNEEESLEWFDFNTISAYAGKNTPVFEWEYNYE
tara:strand:- start:1388 stop:1654 length:267 start_codon:yes stop_codon:yes gene_type:complete